MSYDIRLIDPITGETAIVPDGHDLRGGTYVLGGNDEAWLNVTYNYAQFYYMHLDSEKGIRVLYGMPGAQAIPLLEKAVTALGTNRDSDYWKPTAGNAGAALADLLMLARACPEAVFRGD